jgi:hypothetical protein
MHLKTQKLVHRVHRSLQPQATLSNTAKNQKTTKTREIRAEASQALPAVVAAHHDIDAIITTPLDQAISDHLE